MIRRMNPPRKPGVSAETVAADLTLAVGQLIRRLRSEVDSEGLGMSQTSALDECVFLEARENRLHRLRLHRFGAREPHPTDGRQILFKLTAAGLAARRKRNAAKHQWLGAAIEKLDPQDIDTLAAAIPLIRRIGEQ